MASELGVGDGEHRTADAQTSCDSAGSSDTGHPRTEPLVITGDKTRDAALGEPRIRAGEIIGWRYWRLRKGLLDSVFVPYTWRPGVFERASSNYPGPYNFGYHAFRNIEQAKREAFLFNYCRVSVIGSVAMWGEVIEHKYGWRSEYAAVRSIIKITGGIRFLTGHLSLQELRERYGCTHEACGLPMAEEQYRARAAELLAQSKLEQIPRSRKLCKWLQGGVKKSSFCQRLAARNLA